MAASRPSNNGRTDDKSIEYINPKLYRKFQVQKSTALGLAIPQNLQLEIHHVDNSDGDLGLVYQTGDMSWMDVMTALPPAFTLYATGNSPSMKKDTDLANLLPVAKLKPISWQGYTSPRIDIETYCPDGQGILSVSSSPADQHWSIQRHGWSRRFSLISRDAVSTSASKYTWKGTTSSLSALNDYDFNPNCHGNLKLELVSGAKNDTELLAIWKQQRNPTVLGSIFIFDAAVKSDLPIEAIITSCLCVVIIERVNGMTFLGGLGKHFTMTNSI